MTLLPVNAVREMDNAVAFRLPVPGHVPHFALNITTTVPVPSPQKLPFKELS
jgi:hypothetical protein